MVDMLEDLLALLAGHPRTVVVVGYLRLLGLGAEGAVTALGLFGSVHCVGDYGLYIEL